MEIRKVLTNVVRIIVGVLFIFSGFVKADDPMGFGYKLQEYFSVFGTEFLSPAAVYMSLFFSVFEMFLGVVLLLGIWRNFTVWMLLLMMLFFSFLTFYSAYFNKVTDCGCFGDFMHLKPWTSFQKDLVLLLLIIFLFVNKRFITPIMNIKSSRALALISFFLFLAFGIYALIFLPPIDFRGYKIGNDIQYQMSLGKPAVTETMVVYEKDGKEFKFDVNNLPTDTTYIWKATDVKIIKDAVEAPVHDFAIYNSEGDETTDSFLSDEGYKLMIVQYDLEKSNRAAQTQLNQLIEALQKDSKIKIWALTASSQAYIDVFTKEQDVPYPFYQMDATVLKTMIRSNPGLILYKHNTVIDKWPSTWLPSEKEILSKIK